MMGELITAIQKEKKQLEHEISILKHKLVQYPEGILKINKKKNHTQFCVQMHHESGIQELQVTGPVKNKYIRKKDSGLVDEIIQRDYEKKLLKCLELRYKAIKNVPKIYEESDLIRVYADSHPVRRSRIKTAYVKDEEYAKNWQSVEYQGKKVGTEVPEIYTTKGERVRSKSEKILTDLFERNDVPYRYEYPVKLSGEITVHPDFILLNKKTRKEYYLEHLGMMDDPQYAENALKKIALYEKNEIYPGEKLLITFETSSNPLNTSLVSALIRRYLL